MSDHTTVVIWVIRILFCIVLLCILVYAWLQSLLSYFICKKGKWLLFQKLQGQPTGLRLDLGCFWNMSETASTRYLLMLMDHHRICCLRAAKRSVGAQELAEKEEEEKEGSVWHVPSCLPHWPENLVHWVLMVETRGLKTGGTASFWWKTLGKAGSLWPICPLITNRQQ